MARTSTPHRRRIPKNNRGIPTIPAVRIDVGPLMSTEWTPGRWRERLRGVLVVGPGTSVPIRSTWPLSRVPVAPTQRRPARPPLPGRPTPRGRGSTGQGLCVLHESPTCVEYTRTSSSSTPPSCIAPRRRREPPERPHPASGASSGSRAWETGPTGVLRRHDIRTLRSHKTTQRPAEPARSRRCWKRTVGVVKLGCSTTPTGVYRGVLRPGVSSGAPADRSGPTPWRPRPGVGRRWRRRCRWEAWCRPRRPR